VRGRQQAAASVSLSDATLQAVKAHPDGATANDILNHLSREFGMTVRPNHLGIALQRLRRSGRLENRDQRWYPAQQAGSRIERLGTSISPKRPIGPVIRRPFGCAEAIHHQLGEEDC
jgi:hypothetical protein